MSPTYTPLSNSPKPSGSDDSVGSDKTESRGACAECHSSGIKCVYPDHDADTAIDEEEPVRCERCSLLDLECYPHELKQDEARGDLPPEEASGAESEKNNDDVRADDDADKNEDAEADSDAEKNDDAEADSDAEKNEDAEVDNDAEKNGDAEADSDAEKNDDAEADNDAEKNDDDEGGDDANDAAADGQPEDGEKTSSQKNKKAEDQPEEASGALSEKNDDAKADKSANGNGSAADGQSEDGDQVSSEKKRKVRDDGIIIRATSRSKSDDSKPPPPPSWPDVTWEQLENYPKISLRAQSFFDMQQIRAIKPMTLAVMGISVPNFPDLDNDDIVNMAVKPRSKFQLYHAADVFPSKAKAKPYLQKEILRRAILKNMEGADEDVAHGNIKNINNQRAREGVRRGLPTNLPKPGHYSASMCRQWLQENPPPLEEHEFIVMSARQWIQQMRDQLGNHPSSIEIEEILENYEFPGKDGRQEEVIKKGEGVDTPVPAAEAATATPGLIHGQLNSAFHNFSNQFTAMEPFMNFNPQVSLPKLGDYPSQLAASTNLINSQSQAIIYYQAQLSSVHMQLEALSNPTQFEIYVEKDTFKFNASHFVAYPGFRERLHGHSYRASVKLLGSHQIGRDGYVLDFGCVKSVVKDICKEMNEYFLVPTLSEVLSITVVEDVDDGNTSGTKVCDECDGSLRKAKKRKRGGYPGSVTIVCEDGSTFVFPRQDCLLLPIMHSTAEELAIYLYGRILENLDSGYLLKRGVRAMEVTVSEAVGQDAVFRRGIPSSIIGNEFDVAAYISKASIPVMPCATETEAAQKTR